MYVCVYRVSYQRVFGWQGEEIYRNKNDLKHGVGDIKRTLHNVIIRPDHDKASEAKKVHFITLSTDKNKITMPPTKFQTLLFFLAE